MVLFVMHRTLSTSDEVIEALGGIEGLMELTNSKRPRVLNWRAFQRFPSRMYIIMIGALRSRGYNAPTSLWGMHEADEAVA